MIFEDRTTISATIHVDPQGLMGLTTLNSEIAVRCLENLDCYIVAPEK